MSDNKRMLVHGFGYPYAWVTDALNKQIIIPSQYGEDINLDEYIISFRYLYDEENDDICCIKLGLENVDQLNNPYFKEDIILKVQWGYILPGGEKIKAVTRKVAVRFVNTDYDSDKIVVELYCTDLVSYLKNIRNNRTSDTDVFEEYVKEILRGDFIATRTIEGRTRILVKKETFTFPDKNQQTQYITGSQFQEQPVPILSNEEVAYSLGNDDIIVLKENDLVIKGKSKSIMQSLQAKLNEEIGGPSYINTRDDVIDFIKRDFNQAPYRQYTYAGNSGELIRFNSRTNEVKTRDDQAEAAYLNPESKDVEISRSITATKHEGEYVATGLPEGLNDADVAIAFSNWKKQVQENLSGSNLLNQNDVNVVTFKKTIRHDKNAHSKSNLMGTTRTVSPQHIIKTEITVPTKVLLNTPYAMSKRREAFLENYMMKKIERKFEASVKVIGDPSLISSRVYKFLNLGPRDNGNWYCVSVEHELTPNQGYQCSLVVIRKPVLLARLIERRKYPNHKRLTPESEFEQTEKKFPFNNKKLSQGLDAVDINKRLEQQAMLENYYQGDNDIPFEPKTNINQTNRIINSGEA